MSETQRPSVIISGMYRSGTSIIWRIISEDEFFKWKFYEPLHPDLLNQRKKNSAMNVYLDHPEIVQNWSDNFHINKFKLSKEEDYYELKRYLLDILKPRSITKFTRMTLRLAWLVRNFDNIFIINVIRDPRAVCYSYLTRGSLLYFIKKQKTFRERLKILIYKIENLTTKNSIEAINNRFNKFMRLNYQPIYWYNLYLNQLRDDHLWKNYVKKINNKNPQVKILSLWRINVEQSLKDLNESNSLNYVNIKFEDFVFKPEQILSQIYNKIGMKSVPKEVIQSVYTDANHLENISNHKYNKKLSRNFINSWKNIDKKIWDKAISKSKIVPLMQKLGYI